MGFIVGIIYFVICIIIGREAANKGRSGFGYFFISLFLSPIIGLIFIIALGETQAVHKRRLYEEAEIKEKIALKYKDIDNRVLNNLDNPYIAKIETSIKNMPDTNGEDIINLKANEIIDYLSEAYEETRTKNIWYKVKYDKHEGWCLAKDIRKYI